MGLLALATAWRRLLLGLPLAAGPASAAPLPSLPPLPQLTELARAERRKDEAEVDRLAARLGAARLLRAASDARLDGAVRVAALEALPLVEEAGTALDGLLALVEDPVVGEAALGALRRTAEALGPERAARIELPADVAPRVRAGVVRLVEDTARAPSSRVEAARAAAALGALVRPRPPSPWLALLRDASPEVRRAALGALDAADDPPEQRGELVRRLEFLLADEDRGVAVRAAARLCHLSTAKGWEDALAEPVRERVRALAADSTVDGKERAPLAACLRAFATPADTKRARELDRIAPRRR